jgi:DNA-binding XRE family transcriptional regulator
MTLHDGVPSAAPARIEHSCTWEEMRFGTCRCRPVTTQVNEHSRPSVQESHRQPDRGELAAAELNRAHLSAEFMQHLGTVSCCDRLRILRTAVGWTQSELASQLGISRRSVIRYERAQQRSEWPRLSVLLRLRQVEADHDRQLVGYFSSLGC